MRIVVSNPDSSSAAAADSEEGEMKARYHETKNPLAADLVRDERGDSWEVVAEDYDNRCIVQHSFSSLAALFTGDPAGGKDELMVVSDGATFMDGTQCRWVVAQGRWVKTRASD